MTKIVIRHPASYASERAFVLDVMLGDFLGLEFLTRLEAREDVSITLGETGPELRVADALFRTPKEKWLEPQSLPKLPLAQWRLPDDIAQLPNVGLDTVPVIFGRPVESGDYIARHENGIQLGLDVFGSVFFMLTRYEEACTPEVDEFSRFPASASLAKQAGFLERPIVNEYLEILWACLQILQPGLMRKSRQYQLVVSHDVDRIFDTRGKSWATVAKNAIGDVVKRHDIALAAKRTYSRVFSQKGDFHNEPCNTFDFIMDCSERYGIRSAFNFIAHQGVEELDGDYTVDMPWVRGLLQRIHSRGHELGLHASFNSYDNPMQIATELLTLRTIAEEEGVRQENWGGRQHYLRWTPDSTWQGWEDAGLAYDSTLAFPELVGFRSGTCYEYPTFNLYSRNRLRLRERPLIVMETTLLSESYMSLRAGEILDTISRFSALCRRYNGSFTILWHNDNLAQSHQKKLYRDALEAAQ